MFNLNFIKLLSSLYSIIRIVISSTIPSLVKELLLKNKENFIKIKMIEMMTIVNQETALLTRKKIGCLTQKAFANLQNSKR